VRWRAGTPTLGRVAVEISRRLRSANKALRQPHTEPVLFIGSSSEGLTVATECHRIFSSRPLVLRLWSQGVFQASSTSIESLIAQTKEADFAVLVLTADDVKRTRGTTVATPPTTSSLSSSVYGSTWTGSDLYSEAQEGKHPDSVRSPRMTWVEYALVGRSLCDSPTTRVHPSLDTDKSIGPV